MTHAVIVVRGRKEADNIDAAKIPELVGRAFNCPCVNTLENQAMLLHMLASSKNPFIPAM